MSIIKFMDQAGDTIVEVLVAIAVASGVIGSAYAIVSHTVKSQQQTSERTDALKIAETQLELLRQFVKSPSSPSTPNIDFCMNGGAPDTTTSHCQVGPNNRYEPKIHKSGDTFTVNVSWGSINGSTDSVDLLYKVY